jgi:IPT/TIG domain-containing protein
MATAAFGSALFAQNNPVPLVDMPLAPGSAVPGSAGFKMTINGTGFVSKSVVTWNGAPRATTFVSASRLTAAIPATDVTAAGTASLTVVNPAPGGGRSNVALFEVTMPSSAVSFATTSIASLPNVENVSTIAAADLNGDG